MTKTIMFILMKWRQSGRIMDEYQQTRKESLQPLKDEWKKLTEALESLSD